MKHLFSEWKAISNKIEAGSVYLFLDFDGTLTPIQEHPDNVILSKSVKNIIKKLAKSPGIIVSIISGRDVSDVADRVGVEGITYAGNHGLEVKGPFGRRKLAEAITSAKIFKGIRGVLQNKLGHIDGVYVEDKGLTLSVHYRRVPPDRQQEVKDIFDRVLDPYTAQEQAIVTRGKKVLEVRPPIDWNKGKIVRHLIKRAREKGSRKVFPIYIGDDVTDEDAYAEVNEMSGCSVKVCHDDDSKSSALYYLRDTDEVRSFLETLNNDQYLQIGK